MLNRISRRRTSISGTISGKAKMQKEKKGKVYLPCNSILYNLITSKQTSLIQIMIMMMMTMMMLMMMIVIMTMKIITKITIVMIIIIITIVIVIIDNNNVN